MGAFLVLGLAWRGLATPGGAATPPHYPGVVTDLSDRADVWLVDGFNVLCAGVVGSERSGWWSARRRTELLDRAVHFDAIGRGDAEVWVVFDGARPAEQRHGPVRSVFAPSADDWLLARVRRSDDPSRVALVTADRKLAARARHRGAAVVSPRAFLARCSPG